MSATGRPLLVCEVAGTPCGLERSRVRSWMPASTGGEGEVPWRGERYAVVDLRRLFQLPPAPGEVEAVLVSVESRPLALLADRVAGEAVIDPTQVEPLPWCFGGRERLWFRGVVARRSGRPLVLVNPEGLLASWRALAEGS